jgi:pre-rRNA-processing protein IPI3
MTTVYVVSASSDLPSTNSSAENSASTTGGIQLWSIGSGGSSCNVLSTYKNNVSASNLPGNNCFTFIGEDLFAAPQLTSSTLHIWSWRKVQPVTKCTLPEKLASICASHDGLYCFGGGISGNIYCWQVRYNSLHLLTFQRYLQAFF